MIFAALAMAAVTPPQLRNHQLFVWEDYPYEAQQKGQQGKVKFELDVSSAGGHPTTCRIVESSGSAVLDAATCRLTQRRALFDAPSAVSPSTVCTWTASVLWSSTGINMTEPKDNVICK